MFLLINFRLLEFFGTPSVVYLKFYSVWKYVTFQLLLLVCSYLRAVSTACSEQIIVVNMPKV
jgi:hypothetical protein